MRFPSLLSIASTLALSLTLAACGDDPSIVASWRELPHALDEEQPTVAERDVWQFKEDGTVTLTDDNDNATGTYTIDGDRLTLNVTEGTDTNTIVSTVVLTDDRLLFGALTPAGNVDGAVGNWAGDIVIDGQAVELTMNLRADHTGDFTRTEGTDPTESFTGTWEEQGDSLRFSFTPEPDFTVSFELFRVGEEGLGGPLMEKI